jgi:hypothetical protein
MSRDLRSSVERSEVPGPGTYSGIENIIWNKNPSFSLPKSRRDNLIKSEAPGPGQYESPESYIKVTEKSPDYKFSNDKRLKEEVNFVPGPGNYNPQDIIGKRGLYISSRLKDHEGLNVPGPGVNFD